MSVRFVKEEQPPQREPKIMRVLQKKNVKDSEIRNIDGDEPPVFTILFD